MTKEDIEWMIHQAIMAERARMAAAIDRIEMRYTGYGESRPDYGQFVTDIAKAIEGE